MDKYFFILSLIAVAGGLDLEAELKAQPPFCDPLIPATDVNTTWIKKTEVWYVPYVTRSELIQFTSLFLSQPEFAKISQERAASDACFSMNWDRGDMFGFGKKLGNQNKLHFNPIRPGVVDWESEGQYGASTYFLLTDNLSYVVGVDVFPDGTRGGYVMTPEPDVNKFSHKQVLEWKQKLVDVGFKEGNFVYMPTKCAQDFWESLKLNRVATGTTTNGTSTSPDESDLPIIPSSIK